MWDSGSFRKRFPPWRIGKNKLFGNVYQFLYPSGDPICIMSVSIEFQDQQRDILRDDTFLSLLQSWKIANYQLTMTNKGHASLPFRTCWEDFISMKNEKCASDFSTRNGRSYIYIYIYIWRMRSCVRSRRWNPRVDVKTSSIYYRHESLSPRLTRDMQDIGLLLIFFVFISDASSVLDDVNVLVDEGSRVVNVI